MGGYKGVPAIPSQGGNSGKFLSTNGADMAWTDPKEVIAIGDLSNVTTTTPTAGQLLKWNGSAWVNASQLDSNAVGIGYGVGSGGTVTQATSKSTAVTLNKPTGQITMSNTALAAGSAVGFQLNNTSISPSDTVVVNIKGGFATNFTYRAWAEELSAGGCKIALENRSGVSLSEAIVLNFTVIKGATA